MWGDGKVALLWLWVAHIDESLADLPQVAFYYTTRSKFTNGKSVYLAKICGLSLCRVIHFARIQRYFAELFFGE